MDVLTQIRSAANCNAHREAVAAGEPRHGSGVRLANGLLALGLRPQDRAGVLEDNTLEAAMRARHGQGTHRVLVHGAEYPERRSPTKRR